MTQRIHVKLGGVMHNYNPSTQKTEAREFKFEDNLGLIARSSLEKTKQNKTNPKTNEQNQNNI
jgi:hypothetical protein